MCYCLSQVFSPVLCVLTTVSAIMLGGTYLVSVHSPVMNVVSSSVRMGSARILCVSVMLDIWENTVKVVCI